MAWPLRILAVGAVGVGLLLGPTGLIGNFLEQKWIEPTFSRQILAAEPHHGHNYLLMLISSVVALSGVAIAYLMYIKQPSLADSLAWTGARFYELSRNKFYLDEVFNLIFVKPLTLLAQFLRVVDQYLVDGLVDLVGQTPAFVGYLVRPAQNGLVQFYALLMALGVGGFFLAVLLR
jgi:NADH-quinone oxidoreductase subunit L